MQQNELYILLVDDDPDILDHHALLIRELGFRPITAQNVGEAQKQIARYHSDLVMVIADNIMPGGSGVDLRKTMLPLYESIPFIIISGYVTKETLLDGMDHKVSKFLDKPVKDGEFRETIVKQTEHRISEIKEKRILGETFLGEATDILRDLGPLVEQLFEDPTSGPLANKIFRMVHTLKGASAVLDWSEFTMFLHEYEGFLGNLKKAQALATPEFLDVLVGGIEELDELIKGLMIGRKIPIDMDKWRHLFAADGHESDAKADVPRLRIEPKKVRKEVPVLKVSIPAVEECTLLMHELAEVLKKAEEGLEGLPELVDKAGLATVKSWVQHGEKLAVRLGHRIANFKKEPLLNVFKAFSHIVADLCQHLNKEVRLDVKVLNTMIDHELAKMLNQMLLHVIRNSCDHGIESPDVRVEKGKSRAGVLSISGRVEGEKLVIAVSDDGQGMNPAVLKRTAVERGMMTAEAAALLTDDAAFHLIFEAGFSTAKNVTHISGRGVGMDMVKSAIESCGGTIVVTSTIGRGTKFVLVVPAEAKPIATAA